MNRHSWVRSSTLLGVAAMALTAAARPATATMDMYCGGDGISASFEASSGIVSVFKLRTAGRTWASNPEFSAPGAELIFVRRKLDDGEESQTDFSAVRGGEVIATLRERHARESGNFAWGGVMSIVGFGAWAVSCEG